MMRDIVIVGGGMVGASLACALADSPLRVTLIDATPFAAKEDHRLIALNYSSYCLFKNLNLWSALAPHASPIQQIHVSDRGHFGKVRLHASDIDLSALGFVVPAKYINAALEQRLQSLPHLQILRPAELKQLTLCDGYTELRIAHENLEQTITTKLVVGADGTTSTVRQQLGLQTEEVEYHQSALVTTTTLQRSHLQTAYERFLPTGAIAMLPLSENQCATIWSDDTDKIHLLKSLSDADFIQILQTTFGYALGRFVGVGARLSYPLKMLKSAQTHVDSVVLIGNAAHTLHPVAAQGLNLALSEIAMLYDCLNASAFAFQPGDLNAFFAWQKQQQNQSTDLSHSLVKVFGSTSSCMTAARQWGMLGLDLLKPAKRFFSRRAQGRTGKTPSLLLEQN